MAENIDASSLVPLVGVDNSSIPEAENVLDQQDMESEADLKVCVCVKTKCRKVINSLSL